jgi:hypothetical protein
VADARRERIIHRRVTQRALDAHGGDASLLVEESGDADDGIELEQLERRRRIAEVDLAARDRPLQPTRQSVDVDLQSDSECHRR